MATPETAPGAIPYLITGATGHLGSAIVRSLLTLVPASSLTLTSSSASSCAPLAAQFPGTHFRHANYDEPRTLAAAFRGVQKLFFVSSNVANDPTRMQQQHRDVVDAAKAAGVQHTYYTSQAFGGYGTASPSNVLQTAHLATEDSLKSSGIPYTSLRCSIYAESFQRIVNWYPETTTLRLPAFLRDAGAIAYISRPELGAAIAALLASAAPPSFSHTDNIALLTGPSAPTFSQVAAAIADAAARGRASKTAAEGERKMQVAWVPEAEWPAAMAAEEREPGRRGLPEGVFRFYLGIYRAIAEGEIAAVDPLAEELLGRRPRDGEEVIGGVVERLVAGVEGE